MANCMVIFAAKGKTGCPVRPPELSTTSEANNDARPPLETHLEDSNEGN